MGWVLMDPRKDHDAPEALMAAMDAHMRDSVARGIVLEGGGLDGDAACTEVRLSQGTVSTNDTPYADAAEVVGGYSILEFGSHEEAVREARRIVEIHQENWPGWEGSVVVRRIWDAPPQSGRAE